MPGLLLRDLLHPRRQKFEDAVDSRGGSKGKKHKNRPTSRECGVGGERKTWKKTISGERWTSQTQQGNEKETSDTT